ncbi:PDZ domain-containing protein [Streptomyces griseoviridis]|uniref:PDZ domain-containing protein n=1 Tax=Streptomyces griseoviridis TaxID=45398 RepID=A0A918GM76_STRGD|nr:PDZ domain-containing protein [Streptomyces niveoruber]GGS44704.1 hypothetical protein GCM10010238_37910 [Streptomyces niveoruber]
MEQTALRPKPMPGRHPGGDGGAGAARSPRAARRGGRRLLKALTGLSAGTVLLLAGAGLGTLSPALAGLSRPVAAYLPGGAPAAAAPRGDTADTGGSRTAAPSTGGVPATAGPATLGVSVVDDAGPGALVVAVHDPGPGHDAGLVSGDVLLVFGTTRVDSAADLARAVARARPGTEVRLTVRRAGGGYRQLPVVPGVVV